MLLSFTAAFLVTLIGGDAASTFLYHVPQHIWGNLHLRIHHDARRSFWDHAIISRDPEVLLDGILGALPYIVIVALFWHFESASTAAKAGALVALVLGQVHVWWRHTVELGWSTPTPIRYVARALNVVLPEDHNAHHLDPETGFGDLFRVYDRPARALIAWARSKGWHRWRTTSATAPQVATGIALALIHLGALLAFVPAFFSWSALSIAVVIYYTTGALGICLGYHRLLTHRSFVLPKFFEYGFAILGALALQGDPVTWVATHRAHHAYSDTERDPHNARRGFWWCHISWLVAENPARLAPSEITHFAGDLLKDPFYRVMKILSPWLTLGLGVLLYAAGGPSWVVWGIFARLVGTYHVTWLVNSAAHASGYRRYDAKDLSTNNWVVAFLAWGEGWHNNHHAFPASARHGMTWYEIDVTWMTIRVLAALRIVQRVKLPKITPPAYTSKTFPRGTLVSKTPST